MLDVPAVEGYYGLGQNSEYRIKVWSAKNNGKKILSMIVTVD